jgi:hypothetical protein
MSFKKLIVKKRLKLEPYWIPTFEAKKVEAILDILKLKTVISAKRTA